MVINFCIPTLPLLYCHKVSFLTLWVVWALKPEAGLSLGLAQSPGSSRRWVAIFEAGRAVCGRRATWAGSPRARQWRASRSPLSPAVPRPNNRSTGSHDGLWMHGSCPKLSSGPEIPSHPQCTLRIMALCDQSQGLGPWHCDPSPRSEMREWVGGWAMASTRISSASLLYM